MTKRTIALAAATAALLAPAAASAHVTLQPDSAPAGGFTRLDVRVPNERDDAATTKVVVRFPSGFEHASYEPAAGWDVEVARKGDFVDTITWTAAGSEAAIAPGQFRDFGLSVGLPEGEPGDALTFKALQTYAGGEVVRWIGAADGDDPGAAGDADGGRGPRRRRRALGRGGDGRAGSGLGFVVGRRGQRHARNRGDRAGRAGAAGRGGGARGRAPLAGAAGGRVGAGERQRRH